MTTLLEKLRALAETEKQATDGPWRAKSRFVKFDTDEYVCETYSNEEGAHAYTNAALIAESRTLLKELLASWFAQHEALEHAERCAMTREHKSIYTAARNLATTQHP